MKKAALILTILFLALSLSAQDNTKQYKIGDTGPAGGIIFEVVGNKVWECSEIIGHLPWDKAFKFCPTYNGGGYDDWYLPTKDELESLYYNLIKPGLIHDKETYWSANQEESMALCSSCEGCLEITYGSFLVAHFELHGSVVVGFGYRVDVLCRCYACRHHNRCKKENDLLHNGI